MTTPGHRARVYAKRLRVHAPSECRLPDATTAAVRRPRAAAVVPLPSGRGHHLLGDLAQA
eukprot:scaffold3596_cov316-Prasinococcus_capsulatus_cf.AAC.7